MQPAGRNGCYPGNLAIALARKTSSVYLVSSNQCWNITAPNNSAATRAGARAIHAADGGSASWRSSHEGWWRDFWSESFIAISGEAATRVEAMYYVNMFRYASACRYGVHDLTAAFGPGGMTMQWGAMVWDMNVQVGLLLPLALF